MSELASESGAPGLAHGPTPIETRLSPADNIKDQP